jgi:nucleotide-binding universal stress UspA family protein
LIVVGAHGDSFLTRALHGSVGERLVTRASCDVLIAR